MAERSAGKTTAAEIEPAFKVESHEPRVKRTADRYLSWMAPVIVQPRAASETKLHLINATLMRHNSGHHWHQDRKPCNLDSGSR